MMRHSGRCLSAAMTARAVRKPVPCADRKPSADLMLPLLRQKYGIIEGSPREMTLRAILENTATESELARTAKSIIPAPHGFEVVPKKAKQKNAKANGAPEGHAVWWARIPQEIKNRVKYSDPDGIREMMLRERPEVRKHWEHVIGKLN